MKKFTKLRSKDTHIEAGYYAYCKYGSKRNKTKADALKRQAKRASKAAALKAALDA